MKFTKPEQIRAFMDVVKSCHGAVYLKSPYGDSFNLKSQLSLYVAIGELLKEHGDELELFCQEREDEPLFYEFFKESGVE